MGIDEIKSRIGNNIKTVTEENLHHQNEKKQQIIITHPKNMS